ncbi:MAG: methionyl-tRNA formyltransferase [Gemmatimonadetes bacterium]|nr:methionyl-tRNA formyltransferase [Gemmatimonadota bacterium]
MRILFWGTPDFAVPSLRILDDEGFEIVGVVTRPDRPAGRGRRLTPSPTKQVALQLGLPVLTPERPRGDDFLAEIRALAPDLSVVVAYGHILRPEVLAVPPQGSVNVHASLLPELRGAAPVNWAIARGYEDTGVTVMRMVEAMDAGPVLHQVREPIFPDETATELSVRLSELGAEALLEALELMAADQLEETEQDDALATFAPKVDRATARIDWTRRASEVALHVRGMDAVPGAWSELEGVPVKLFRPSVVDDEVPPSQEPACSEDGGAVEGPAGTSAGGLVVCADEAGRLVVRVGDGALRFHEVQPPGRRRMSAADWIHGRGISAGQRFV